MGDIAQRNQPRADLIPQFATSTTFSSNKSATTSIAMRGGSKKFFFINKTAGSDYLTHSPGEQWSEIQKHVQTGLKRPRKKGSASPGTADDVNDKAFYNSNIRCVSTKFDPFSTASVDIDSAVRSLLHYYIYDYHPTIWTQRPEALGSRPYAFRSSVIRVINTAVCDSLAMYSLLSAASSRIQYIHPLSLSSASSTNGHLYIERALQLMFVNRWAKGQQRIDGKAVNPMSKNQMLLCTMFLTSAEVYRDNYAAARIHQQIAFKLLEPGGVMAVTDKNIQGQLLMSDVFLACIEMKPCLCGHAYDPGPASHLTLVEKELLPVHNTCHGTAFLDKDSFILPTPLWQIVRDILESYRIHIQLSVAVMDPTRAFETTEWAMKRNMAIRARILAVKSSDQRVFVLKITLIMWTLLAMNVTGRLMTVKIMARRLKTALEENSSLAWRGYEDVNLWILLVGYCCARDGSSELAWFADQIKEGNVRLRYSTILLRRESMLQSLEAFSAGFLYHRPLQRSRIEEVAKLLETSDAVEL